MRIKFLSRIAAALAGSIFIAQALHAAEPVGQIRGIVKNEQGAPLPSVKVQMCGFETLADGTWRRELRTGLMPSYTTDDEGRFTIPVHDPSMRYDFFCDKPGYAPAFLYAVTNNSPELTVVLTRGLTVSGTVRRLVNGKPEPVTGSQVELRLPYVDLWYQQRTTTDQHGQYTFRITPQTGGRRWQVVFAGEVVQLDVREGLPVQGPDFDLTVSVSWSALLGRPLPALADLQIEPAPGTLAGRAVAVCFFDLQERPSRHSVAELLKQSEDLKARSVEAILIQSSAVPPAELRSFVATNRLTFPIGMIRTDEAKTLSTWGVKSRPWLILTDTDHVIRAEGFGVEELSEKLKSIR